MLPRSVAGPSSTGAQQLSSSLSVSISTGTKKSRASSSAKKRLAWAFAAWAKAIQSHSWLYRDNSGLSAQHPCRDRFQALLLHAEQLLRGLENLLEAGILKVQHPAMALRHGLTTCTGQTRTDGSPLHVQRTPSVSLGWLLPHFLRTHSALAHVQERKSKGEQGFEPIILQKWHHYCNPCERPQADGT